MSENPQPEAASLPLSAARQLDQVCSRFERDWQAGARPSLRAFLAETPEAARPELLRDLLRLELHYRAGERPTPQEYLDEFPAHAELILAVFRQAEPLPPQQAPSQGPACTPETLAVPWGQATQQAAPSPSEEITLPPGPAEAPVEPAPPGSAEVPAEPWPTVPGYEILGELGRHGMGVVYQARQVQARRVVALKMIKAGAQATAEDLARFRIEVEAVARLQHPHIVQIHEVGEHQGQPFFSMEFCGGGSLAAQLDGTPWQPQRAAELVETLARATHVVHSQNILHRDLKPHNVLLTGDGTPKVADFGLAKRLDESSGMTRTGEVMGTPSYMAPEQAQGKNRELNAAVDVYALGAILYELLTGRPPFRGPTTLDTILQVINDEPVPPSRLQPKMPRDLETICLKCLQKEPAARYADCQALAEDLRRWLAGEPIRARRVGRLERLRKWVRRRPAATLVAVLLPALSAVVALTISSRIQEAQNEKDAALVASLLSLTSPLPHTIEPAEEETFWKLTQLPNDRVRLRFLNTALDSGDIGRVTLRADLVIQALVGVDSERRQQFNRLLADKYRANTERPHLRTACLLLAATLAPSDDQMTREILDLLQDLWALRPGIIRDHPLLRMITDVSEARPMERVLKSWPDEVYLSLKDSERPARAGWTMKELAGGLDCGQCLILAAQLKETVNYNGINGYYSSRLPELIAFAAATKALAARLDRQQAEPLIDSYVSRLLNGSLLNGKWTDSDEIAEAETAVKQLASEADLQRFAVAKAKSDPTRNVNLQERQQAVEQARQLVWPINPRDPVVKREQAWIIQEFAESLNPEEAKTVAFRLTDALTKASLKASLNGNPCSFAVALRKVAKRLDLPGLVDVLKAPTCIGYARAIVLEELGRRAGQPFHSRWDFADWARQHAPQLDLRSPVQRPD